MSYAISLRCPHCDQTLHFDEEQQFQGGTYAVGGTTDAWLNITYNYGSHFRRVVDNEQGIRFLYGMTGLGSIPVLGAAIDALDDDVDDDYWKATEGNAKRALSQMLAMARLLPEGVWRGD